MHSTTHWRFGPFRADAQEYTLWRGDEAVPVTRKAFVLLATLLSRPGKLFTKAELFSTVWAGSVVSDAALARAVHELRAALGDDANAPRYIATAFGLGFRFIATVDDEAHGAAAGAPLLLAPPGLVGREPELARLDQALTLARAGQRQVVFVTGEAGIGKTTLVEAFVARAAGAAEIWVAQGRCIEQYGTAEAYLPILEALEQLARQAGNEAMRSTLASYAPAWLALLPWIARRSGVRTASPRPPMLREICGLAVLDAEPTLDEAADALECPQCSAENLLGGFVRSMRPRACISLLVQAHRAPALGHGSQCVDAALVEHRFPGVRGLPRHAHGVCGLRRRLARQEHPPRSQAPPNRLVQPLCRHACHPILAKYRHNARRRYRLS